MKQKAKITDYEILPFFGKLVLTGKIIDHPRQNEFVTDRQMTSLLKNINFDTMTAETENTIYELVNV